LNLTVSFGKLKKYYTISNIEYIVITNGGYCFSSYYFRPSPGNSKSSRPSSSWTQYLAIANRYLFTGLSFLPGIYFAFKYEHFILRPYLFIHLGTTVYFFYKRFKEFEVNLLSYFEGIEMSLNVLHHVAGVGMSAALCFVGPFLRFVLGAGFGGFLDRVLDMGLAVAFLLRMPQKYVLPNMMFGLNLVKYLVCFLSWQTCYILMIFATWNNLGAEAQAFVETYRAIEVNPSSRSSNGNKNNERRTD
jgi:hypothetical protein